MSRQFNAKHHVLNLFPEPCDEGVDLFLDFLDVSRKDFEYEESQTVEEYIWKKPARSALPKPDRIDNA